MQAYEWTDLYTVLYSIGIYFKFCTLKLHFIQKKINELIKVIHFWLSHNGEENILIDGLINKTEFPFTLAVTTEASKSCKNPSCDGVQA